MKNGVFCCIKSVKILPSWNWTSWVYDCDEVHRLDKWHSFRPSNLASSSLAWWRGPGWQEPSVSRGCQIVTNKTTTTTFSHSQQLIRLQDMRPQACHFSVRRFSRGQPFAQSTCRPMPRRKRWCHFVFLSRPSQTLYVTLLFSKEWHEENSRCETENILCSGLNMFRIPKFGIWSLHRHSETYFKLRVKYSRIENLPQ